MKPLLPYGLLLCLVAASLGAAPQAEAQADGRDVVIVLDNSASMRRNDRQFLAKQAVLDFVAQLDSNSRAGLVIFDSEARLVVELSYATEANRPRFVESLGEVTYWGRHTDSAAALERAIYHLKWDGRTEADKSIIFLTDGRVETGNEERNRAMTEWIQTDLAQSAAESGIRVFGIAFTEDADFQTIQTLSSRSGGEYMRVFSAGELPVVFERVQRMMTTPDETVIDGVVIEHEDEAAVPAVEVVDAEPSTQDAATPGDTGSDGWPPNWPYWALLVVASLGLALFLLRNRKKEAPMPEQVAVLTPMTPEDGSDEHTLGAYSIVGRRPLQRSRVRGAVGIVIDHKAVSRKHAVIEHRRGQYFLRDAGTLNGTFVNGEKIEGDRLLRHGDVVRFEKHEFAFQYADLREDPDATVLGEGLADDDATVFSADMLAGALDGDSSVGETTSPSVDEKSEDGDQPSALDQVKVDWQQEPLSS